MSVKVLVADGQILFGDALAMALGAEADFDLVDERPVNSVEALRAAVDHRPEVTLVDYWLGDTGGPAVTRQILHRVPQTNVVHLGWFHHPDHSEVSLRAGAVGFLPKSLGLAELGEAIRRAYHGECPVFEAGLGQPGALLGEREEDTGFDAGALAELSPRELEVLRHLAAGLSVVEVAARLGIRLATARTHADRILNKTGARSQLEAVAMARDRGVLH